MTRKLQVAVASVLVAVAVAAPAAADSGRRADFDLRFTTQAPDAPTGLAFHILYKDERDPNGKPQPIRRLVIAAPEGTRFDGRAVPRCSASDDDLRMHGRAACPAASEVGRGVLTVATGFGPPVDPVTTEATLYNGGDQMIEVVSDPSSGAPLGSDRLHINGSQLVANPPAIPGGPPDGQSSVRLVDEHIDPHGGFVVTPPSCSGAWAAHGTFGFADGAFETVGSTLPCAATRLRTWRGIGNVSRCRTFCRLWCRRRRLIQCDTSLPGRDRG